MLEIIATYFDDTIDPERVKKMIQYAFKLYMPKLILNAEFLLKTLK